MLLLILAIATRGIEITEVDESATPRSDGGVNVTQLKELVHSVIDFVDKLKVIYPPLRLVKYIPSSTIDVVCEKAGDVVPSIKDVGVKFLQRGTERVMSVDQWLREVGGTVLNATREFAQRSSMPGFVDETTTHLDTADYAYAVENKKFLAQVSDLFEAGLRKTERIMEGATLGQTLAGRLPPVFVQGFHAVQEKVEPIVETFKGIDKAIRMKEAMSAEPAPGPDTARGSGGLFSVQTARTVARGVWQTTKFTAWLGYKTVSLLVRGVFRAAMAVVGPENRPGTTQPGDPGFVPNAVGQVAKGLVDDGNDAKVIATDKQSH